jgi:cytochrome c-type biogenesis protein CcmH/NrfG
MLDWKKVVLILGAMICVVVLYLLPTPNSKFREVTINTGAAAESSTSTPEEKVAKALEIIQGGGAPMQGIQLLLEVIETEPNNIEALYYLGDFSMKTGQYQKAEERFSRLVKIQPTNDRFWYMLAQSQEMGGNSSSAIESYKSFLNYGKDSIIVETVRKKIEELKK